MKIEYLIEKYSKLIYKICMNILNDSYISQDITQEVYISIYTNINKYSSYDENILKNIICKITLNKCRDYLRKKKSEVYDIENTDEELENIIDNVDIEDKIFEKHRKNMIHNMINNLKPPYNTILYEYYINESTLDNLSEKLNIEKSTLKVQIYRGKKMLKDILEKEGEIY